jgi:type IV pilus assembly protein PilB
MTPNDPGAPKKPAPGADGGQPAKPAGANGPQPAPRPAGQGGQPAPRPAGQGGQPAKPAGAGQPQRPSGVTPKPATPGVTPKKPATPPAKPGSTPAAKPGGGTPAKAGGKPAPKPAPAKPAKPGQRERGTRKLGQVLVDLGYIDENQLWEVLDEAKNANQRVGDAAVARGLITEDQLLQALAEQHGLKTVNLQEVKPHPDALKLVPEPMAGVYKIVPLFLREKVLTIAIADPNNLAALDDLRNLLGLTEVVAQLAPQAQLTEALAKAYAGKEESIVDIINELEKDPDVSRGKRQKETSIDLDAEIADTAPVRKLINMVFLLAIRDRASDVHFEPFEDEYKMRYRADGILYEMVPPPRHLAQAISTRIKVMSNLDIAERRLPQDGRIELNVGGNPVDMRVSVLPTMFGESVVVRVLDRTVVSLDLNKLGMEPEMLQQFRELIGIPNGIILCTGPTGAGKTTTLYSALNELNVISDKLITTEDPVEYEIDGIIQVPINHDIGLTFANALRAILRQDPDKILVGEIRDLETAQIAVQASLTGHTVFSTLHTNDAPSSVTRLRDMGVEPFLITATVEGILAQRLVRRICEDCRTEFDPSREMLMELNLTPEEVEGKQFYYGRGCDRCNNTGHRGRLGLYELMMIDDDVRDLISAGASTDQLRNLCRKKGMATLRESGLRAIFRGHTTIEEVVRETIMEEES